VHHPFNAGLFPFNLDIHPSTHIVPLSTPDPLTFIKESEKYFYCPVVPAWMRQAFRFTTDQSRNVKTNQAYVF
jgi:hypothetical protein